MGRGREQFTALGVLQAKRRVAALHEQPHALCMRVYCTIQAINLSDRQ